MSGPAPKPTAAQLATARDVLMDLADHVTGHELDVVRDAVQVLQRHIEEQPE